MNVPRQRPAWHAAYDAQMELWRWYATDEGRRWILNGYRTSKEGIEEGFGAESDRAREAVAMLADLYSAETGRLIDCDPIFVSQGMCDVARAALEGFAPEPLLESDVITPRGFMYFAQPFDVYDRFDKPVQIPAVSWMRIWNASSPEQKAELEEKVHREDAARSVRSADEVIERMGIDVAGLAMTIYCMHEYEPGYPEILPMHVTPWYIGMTYDGNEVDVGGQATGAAWWWRVVQVTFRLMQQRLAVRHIERPDRASRRRAAVLKMHDETEIVIVRLRHEDSPRSERTGETANYSHRFIVGGHWRNAWYPSQGIHRQIWISPYIKGPEDKPLIVRPRRVFQWTR